jgi:glycosyl transferase family 25
MFEFIEKVVYINLEHRTDRKQQIEGVLSKFPAEKVVRFNAVKNEQHGGMGCTQSHIGVLEMAILNGWKNVLIVEDDCMWNRFEAGYPILEKLVQKEFDVITLGIVFPVYDLDSFRLYKGQTTTSYLVNQSYYQTLLNNFKEGLQKFQETGHYAKYALDQYWKPLQLMHKWYSVIPSLLIQRESYSDIEKGVIDNGKYFS